LDTDGALAINAAITMLRDIADALAHAHEAGVVHRDLKPDNVLCVGDHAFLLDFGVAKLETGSPDSMVTDPGIAIGTPGYMAPEQAAGGPVDHRADIYAWGLVAREILTGKRGPAARLGDRPDVPEALRALVEATLAIDPAERPTRARSLAAALDAMLAPIPRRRGHWQWVAAALVAGVGGWWLANRSSAPISVDQLVQPIAVAPLIDARGDSTLAGPGRPAGGWLPPRLRGSGGPRGVARPPPRPAARPAGRADRRGALQRGTGAGTLVLGSI